MFYLTTHSSHFIYGYMALDMVNDPGYSQKKPLFDWQQGFFYTHSTHFYLRSYGVGYMVKDHSDSERGNLLSPPGLLFSY